MSTPPLDQEVMKKIEEQRLTMRSKRNFVAHRACSIAVMTLCALFMVLLASFMLYALHRTGVLYLPLLGSGALTYLLHPFSWLTGLLFFGGPLLVIIIGAFIGKKARLYRMPLLYVWLILGTSFLAIGGLLFVSPLHGVMRSFAESRRLPILDTLYNAATCGTETHTATGVVREVTPDGFKLLTLSKKAVVVKVTDSTIFQKGYIVRDNDAVIVVGRTSDSVMTAEFVHRSPTFLSEEETEELCNLDVNGNTAE